MFHMARNKAKKIKSFLFVFLIGIVATTIPANSKAHLTENKKSLKSERMSWWREARFGMFIHWGLYAIPAGEWKGVEYEWLGEWIMQRARIPSSEYGLLKDQFDPVRFDANNIVRLAKDAGMKYLVITSKHHDGFSLFDSKYSDYDVMSTPFKRDIIKEFADACRRHNIRFGLYYSSKDWHHPEFPAEYNRGDFHGDPKPDADMEKYITYMKNQLIELLTDYGSISVAWFDFSGVRFESSEERAHVLRAEEIVSHVRALQPDIIINDRVGIPADYGTPEQEIPDIGIPGRDWETCQTMNDTWGYKKNDQNWKSSAELIGELVETSSKGGNYLLNIGPTALGEVPQASVERLRDMGKWLQINGESIYGTKASPFTKPSWGWYTQRGLPGDMTRLYCHVLDWPDNGKLVIEGLTKKPEDVFLLADENRNPLQVSQKDNMVMIPVSENNPDPIDSVVVLDIIGKLN
jgi:alpha-L-fucosidase